MKVLLIQARMSSSRFPRKVLCNICEDIAMLEFIYKRCSQSQQADMVAVITSDHQSDDGLFDYCSQKKIKAFRGSLDNVLSRYIKACEFFSADVVCRVCADSPFVDIKLLDKMFSIQEKDSFDYVAPDKNDCIAGFDSEIITLAALKKVSNQALTPEDYEHVTRYIKNNPGIFKGKIIPVALRPPELGDIKLTVDESLDLNFCRQIIDKLDDKYSFTSEKIIGLIKDEFKASIP